MAEEGIASVNIESTPTLLMQMTSIHKYCKKSERNKNVKIALD